MNQLDLVLHLKNIGLSEKASKLYLSSLELGEATILELSRKSKIPRTTIYYSIQELQERGLMFEEKRGKKVYYMYTEPELVLKEERQKILSFDEILPELEEVKWRGNRKPRVEFYFGVSGFKEVWEKILRSNTRDFCLITDPDHFAGYVKDKYIREQIIDLKLKNKIVSRQLIIDSSLGKYIVSLDSRENRQSKFLPKNMEISFTEVITDKFVAIISNRMQNTIFTIDHEGYAKTRRQLFDLMWSKN